MTDPTETVGILACQCKAHPHGIACLSVATMSGSLLGRELPEGWTIDLLLDPICPKCVDGDCRNVMVHDHLWAHGVDVESQSEAARVAVHCLVEWNQLLLGPDGPTVRMLQEAGFNCVVLPGDPEMEPYCFMGFSPVDPHAVSTAGADIPFGAIVSIMGTTQDGAVTKAVATATDIRVNLDPGITQSYVHYHEGPFAETATKAIEMKGPQP